MSGAYVIEIEDRTAGLVIAEKGGYRFVASDRLFRRLDGRLFSEVRKASSAAAEIWRQHQAKSPRATPPVGIAWGVAGGHDGDHAEAA